jgi:hypothetical protein
MKDLGILVPATTNRRDWKKIEETDLYSIFLGSLTQYKPEFNIIIYIGYDFDDDIYCNPKNRLKFEEIFQKFKFIWIPFNDDYSGYPTAIWNKLGNQAVKDGIEYMYVCGSDIEFCKDNGWVGMFIKKLKKNNNIGWSAPWSNNDEIPTQFLIHKTHIDIFGFVYPPEIKNWGCDNWIDEVYSPKYRNWFKNIHHLNLGGKPRYDVVFSKTYVEALVKRYRPRLTRYLQKI